MKIHRWAERALFLFVSTLTTAPIFSTAASADWNFSTSVEDVPAIEGTEVVTPVSAQSSSRWRQNQPAPQPSRESDPVRDGFWDRSQGILEELCEELPIQVDILGINTGINRSVYRYEDRTLALIDETNLHFSFGTPHSYGGGGSPAVIAGARFDGRSIVVRPLPANRRNRCRELLRAVDLRTAKVIVPGDLHDNIPSGLQNNFVPFSAQSVGAMQVGEIWKLPVVLEYRLGGAAGGSRSGGSSRIALFSTRENGVSATLRRMGPNELRFRLRLTHVQSFVGEGRAEVFPVGDLVGGSLSFLNGALRDFLTLNLDIFSSNTNEQEILIEHTFDPTSAQDVERLQNALEGDMDIIRRLREMARESFRLDAPDIHEELGERVRNYGGADYSASREESRRDWGFRLGAGVVFDFNQGGFDGLRRQVRRDGDGGEFIAFGARRHPGLTILQQGGNEQWDVEVDMHRDAEGRVSSPIAIYTGQNRIRGLGGSWRGALEEANSILRYVGTRGNGTDPSNEIPAELDGSRRGGNVFERVWGGLSDSLTRDGRLYFRVVLGQRAVSEILAVRATDILRAYANTLNGAGDRNFVNALSRTNRETTDSRGVRTTDLNVDAAIADMRARGELRRAPDQDAYNRFVQMADNAAKLIRDLNAARTGSPEARAEAFADLMYGNGDNQGRGEEENPRQFSPDQVLPILVQFVNPENFSATVDICNDPGRGPRTCYQGTMSEVRPEDQSLVREIGDLNRRFPIGSNSRDDQGEVRARD